MISSNRTYDFNKDRILVWFSCGATSAIAAKIAVDELPHDNLEILYCDTASEHPSNMTFLKQIEEWLDYPIKILKSEKYKDIWDVFKKDGWLVGPKGARCTLMLKKAVRQKYEELDDIQIFGFDYSKKEIKRAHDMIEGNPEIKLYAPLIEKEITKGQCIQIIKNLNSVDLPFMYQRQKSGAPYGHNNCIGCVKGQQGYWNKIRIDFPDVFERMKNREVAMGITVNKKYMKYDDLREHMQRLGFYHQIFGWFSKNREKIMEKKDEDDYIRVPLFLKDLDPKAGNFEDEEKIDCDMFCQVDAADFLQTA